MNFSYNAILNRIINDFIDFLAILTVDKRISNTKKFLLIHKYLIKMHKEYKNLINEE